MNNDELEQVIALLLKSTDYVRLAKIQEMITNLLLLEIERLNDVVANQ